jgi:hypothetical protein
MQRAQRRKFHYIYKTTCIITERFYIGMHSTDNLEDGYVGSGKRLWHSINKHGKENHVCEILEFLPDRKSLVEREKEIVNIEMLNEELCMNLKLGGDGGCTREVQKTRSSAGGKAFSKMVKTNPDALNNLRQIARLNIKKANYPGRDYNTFGGKSHTEETKQLMSIKAKERTGDKNSQFGTCWITNDVESKKIPKGNVIPEGWRLGRKIK